jgi:hypothetical protein
VAAKSAQSVRVLLVGKRERVLDEAGQQLRNDGYQVHEETDIEKVKSTYDGANLDVLAVGRAVRQAKREDLVTALRMQKPTLTVVDGFAPMVPILVAQVREALSVKGTPIVGDAGFEDANNRVVLVINQHADVSITLYRLDPLHRVQEVPVYVGPLERGTHNLPLLKPLSHRGERFLVVKANDQTAARVLG